MPRKKMDASTDAQHNPVMAGPQEQQFDPSMVPQRGVIDIDHDPGPGIAIAEKMPKQDYMDAVKFGEDPVTVVITPSSDRTAARYVYCAVNGRPAEVWDGQRKVWLSFKYLPVGVPLTVKRKYLEVLARARTDTFRTESTTPTPLPNQDGFQLHSETSVVAPFNVRHDPAGAKGHEWYSRVISEF